jgi:hypothetical protein
MAFWFDEGGESTWRMEHVLGFGHVPSKHTPPILVAKFPCFPSLKVGSSRVQHIQIFRSHQISTIVL